MLLKMNVLILCGEPLFTYLDPNISVKRERALQILMFFDVKIGELYLGYNYEEGGAAAELPSCPQSWERLLPPSQLPHVQKIRHTTSQCSLDNSFCTFAKMISTID